MNEKFWAESMNLSLSLTQNPPAELAVGDRVQDMYADTWGTVDGFVGSDEVLVTWDDETPEDAECGPVYRHEVVKPS